MKNKQDIENKAEQALDSLNNLQNVDANDYLYSKVMQRIDARPKIPVNYNRAMLRLAAALLLLTSVNISSYYLFKKHAIITAEKEHFGADVFADTYKLNNYTDSY